VAESTLNGTESGTADITTTVDDGVDHTYVDVEGNPIITHTANYDSLNVGETGIFTLTISNDGPDPITNIQITTPAPDGFTAGTPTIGSYTDGVWTITSLGSGISGTLT